MSTPDNIQWHFQSIMEVCRDILLPETLSSQKYGLASMSEYFANDIHDHLVGIHDCELDDAQHMLLTVANDIDAIFTRHDGEIGGFWSIGSIDNHPDWQTIRQKIRSVPEILVVNRDEREGGLTNLV